jgi:leucyl-tRNA synthetase
MYNHKEIENKWQKIWEESKTYKVENDFTKPKYYCLDMFPYPSGAGLHVGHPEGMTANDIVARYKTAKGYNVLHPMGWDAFGLPAENYAIKTGTHPRITTDANISNFKKQIKALGFSYDWDREIDTTDPEYYKWTQWIFLKLFEKGLAYEQNLPINYCPSCKTGLANEEVLNDFTCERCGTKVEKKRIRQWVLGITQYAERLLSDVDRLDWPEGIKEMQRNWIGKSQGCEFNLKKVWDESKSIGVYTTRVDTVFGMTYAVLAPDHIDVMDFITDEQKQACLDYIDESNKKSDQDRTQDDKEKTGVFTGSYVINPFNGKEVPLWIGDYVLGNYWTGAVMAVPAHDVRDFAFAKQYDLEIIESISGWDISEWPLTKLWTLVNSGEFTGLISKEAQSKMIAFAEENNFGTKKVNFKLRDWLFSRQRYWGEPIPLVHCDDCGTVAEKEENLPILLPDTENFEPSWDGTSPLSKIDSFVNCECPVCAKPAKRETNTMPQWGWSCWYYLRYMDPNNSDALVNPEVVKYWGEVDSYVGGAEHAVLHLLYARFWHKFLFDIGVVPTDEPFYRLRNQGLILAHAFQRQNGGLVANDMVEEKDGKYFEIETGLEVDRIVSKMSKSLKNVVNPDDIVEEYGADSLRLYEMYMAEFKDAAPWDSKGIVWVRRFLDKAERIFGDEPKISTESDEFTEKLLHKTIKKIESDIDNYKFNTAIAGMMILINNGLPKSESLQTQWKDIFVKLLHPFAPHLAEELNEKIWNTDSVFKSSWPVYEESKTVDNTITIWVQVLGKLRGDIEIVKDEDKDSVLKKARENENVAKWLVWKNIVKEIYVPGRIVNIVVK